MLGTAAQPGVVPLALDTIFTDIHKRHPGAKTLGLTWV